MIKVEEHEFRRDDEISVGVQNLKASRQRDIM